MAIPDVLIVGAGIVGSACADALSADGLRVEVLEESFPGGGATAAAMGHLVVMDDSEAQFALTAYSRRLWTELAPELPADCEDERTGTLWIAADEREMDLIRAKAVFHRERRVEAEILDASALARLEPNLRSGLAGALRVPGDRVLYPPAAARWLLARAVSRGALVRRGAHVRGIGAGFISTGAGILAAGAIVNAAGIAASRLVPRLPIEPRKGHLVITDRYPGFCRHQLVELGYLASAHAPSRESVAFNLQPRATGQMLLGSSREFAGADASLNRRVLHRMIGRALSYVPAIGSLSALRTWVGFRPATPDNLPLVGRWESLRGVFVAAGHEGLGVTTSLGTARLLADLIAGQTPAIDPMPYAPMRDFPGGAHA